MSRREQLWRPFDYSGIDEQIDKFRQLADAYRQDNIIYYGEYLSSILFGDNYPESDAAPESRPDP